MRRKKTVFYTKWIEKICDRLDSLREWMVDFYVIRGG